MAKHKPCDHHPIYMKEGNNNFINMMCKLCDSYIKHASHYEQKVYEKYRMNNEHNFVTVKQCIEEGQELKAETFHLDPEQYIDAFGNNVIWLDVHYRNKELAKQYKALWEPRLKMWYTYVNNQQAIKLIEWMTQQDIDRVYDYRHKEETLNAQYRSIINTKRGTLEHNKEGIVDNVDNLADDEPWNQR